DPASDEPAADQPATGQHAADDQPATGRANDDELAADRADDELAGGRAADRDDAVADDARPRTVRGADGLDAGGAQTGRTAPYPSSPLREDTDADLDEELRSLVEQERATREDGEGGAGAGAGAPSDPAGADAPDAEE